MGPIYNVFCNFLLIVLLDCGPDPTVSLVAAVKSSNVQVLGQAELDVRWAKRAGFSAKHNCQLG